MKCSRISRKISLSLLRCCSLVETIQFLMCLSSKKTGKDWKVNGWTTWYDIDELNSCSFIPFKVQIFHSILKSSHYAPQCHSRPNYFTQHDFIWCKFLIKQIFAFYWASVVSSFPQLYFNQNFRNRHLLFLNFFFFLCLHSEHSFLLQCPHNNSYSR